MGLISTDLGDYLLLLITVERNDVCYGVLMYIVLGYTRGEYTILSITILINIKEKIRWQNSIIVNVSLYNLLHPVRRQAEIGDGKTVPVYTTNELLNE